MKNRYSSEKIIKRFLENCTEEDLSFRGMKLSKEQFKQRFLMYMHEYEKNRVSVLCELPREKYEMKYVHPYFKEIKD